MLRICPLVVAAALYSLVMFVIISLLRLDMLQQSANRLTATSLLVHTQNKPDTRDGECLQTVGDIQQMYASVAPLWLLMSTQLRVCFNHVFIY